MTHNNSRTQDPWHNLAEQEFVTFTTEGPELKRLVTTMEEWEKQIEEIIDGIEREWASVGALLKDVKLLCKLKQKEKAARKTRWKIVMKKMNKGDTRLVGSVQAKGISTRVYAGTWEDLLAEASAWSHLSISVRSFWVVAQEVRSTKRCRVQAKDPLGHWY